MITTSSRSHRTTGLTLLACLSACASDNAAHHVAPIAPHELVVEGIGRLTSERHTATRFGARIEELLAAGRLTSARIEADRYPELWLPLLCEWPQNLPRTIGFLAERFDQSADGPGNCRREFSPALLESDQAAAARDWRTTFARHMEGGRFDQALAEHEDISEATSWVLVDRTELRGWALRFAGRNDDARACFERAATMCLTMDRHHHDRLRLLSIVVTPVEQRGSDQRAAWSEIANRTVAASTRHPEFLRLLLQARPTGQPWPPQLSPRALLSRVGALYLDRRDGSQALVMLQRAEAEPGRAPSDARIKLDMAQAFQLLGRTDAARTLFVDASSSELRAEALVALAILEVRSDRVERGRRWMESALESLSAEDAPLLHADLALVELLCADDEVGLQRLERCKLVLQRDGRVPDLIRLMSNEQAFHESVGNTEAARRARSELVALEAGRVGPPR